MVPSSVRATEWRRPLIDRGAGVLGLRLALWVCRTPSIRPSLACCRARRMADDERVRTLTTQGMTSMDATPEPLRVLVADGRPARLREIAQAVAPLGQASAREGDLNGIGSITAAERPDVAIVIVGDQSEQALALIGKIVHEASCPVIAIPRRQDRTFIREAAKRASSPTSPGRRSPGPELHRHRAQAIRRVSRPRGRVLASRGHRESKESSWSVMGSTRKRRSRCCATSRAEPIERSLMSRKVW